MPKKLQTQRASDRESSVLIGRLMREQAREDAKQLKTRLELRKKGMDDAQRRRETIEYRRILSERMQAFASPGLRQPSVAPTPASSRECEHSLAKAANEERAARRAKEHARLARKTDRQRRRLRRLRIKQLAMALARSEVPLRGRRRPTSGRRVAGRGNAP